MAEEMRFHIEQYTADLVRSGVPPAEAARRARRSSAAWTTPRTTAARRAACACSTSCRQDLRYAARLLRKTPGFTATALATLALCLGANLTIFAVVDAVLLRPLPFPAAGRLVSVYNTYPKAGVPNDGCSLANYYERRGQIAGLLGAGGLPRRHGDRRRDGRDGAVPVTRVSPDFFSTLGLGPVMGRVFTEAETLNGTNDVAILTDGYWRQRLGADPQRDRTAASASTASTGPWSASCRPPSGSSRPRPGSISRSRRARRACAAAAAFRDRAHDRSAPARGRCAEAQAQIDAHNAAVAVNGIRGEDDGRRRLPLAGGAPPCRPRGGDPPHPAADPGGRAVPAPHRRRQPGEPAADPRQRPGQGARRPPGARREPAARGQRRPGGDDPADADRGAPRAGRRRRGHPPPGRCWASTTCPWDRTSSSTRAWRWSRWPARSSSAWGSRSACLMAWLQPAQRGRRSLRPSPAAPRPAGRRSACATASSSPRSPWPSCCSPGRACSGSASEGDGRSPRDSGAEHVLSGQLSLPREGAIRTGRPSSPSPRGSRGGSATSRACGRRAGHQRAAERHSNKSAATVQGDTGSSPENRRTASTPTASTAITSPPGLLPARGTLPHGRRFPPRRARLRGRRGFRPPLLAARRRARPAPVRGRPRRGTTPRPTPSSASSVR